MVGLHRGARHLRKAPPAGWKGVDREIKDIDILYPHPIIVVYSGLNCPEFFERIFSGGVSLAWRRVLDPSPQEDLGMAIGHVDEARLEDDTAYRFGYVAGFIGFGEDDVAAIHAAAPRLAPLVPGLVDAVYEKLFSTDATKRHFVPRQSGWEGAVPVGLDGLRLDHPMVVFRKQHLSRYLVKLVTAPYDEVLVGYLNHVGKIHTPAAGSPDLDVPLVQMDALMGFVSQALTATILGLNLERAAEQRTLLAFTKLLWIQNDLIVRHYQHRGSVVDRELAALHA